MQGGHQVQQVRRSQSRVNVRRQVYDVGQGEQEGTLRAHIGTQRRQN